MRRLLSWLVLLAITLAGGFKLASADPADRDSLAFFENEIRPLLVQHCIKCHGPQKSMSGLRLDSIAAALAGGDRGPALIAGQPDTSLVILAVRHEDDLEMPPGERLEDREIAALVRWIRSGAAWPDGMMIGGSGPHVRGGPITDEERGFWSFQAIAEPQPPDVEEDEQIHGDIDRFVIARLREAKLEPVRPADRRTLIRRATFDLTGLPPTPDEIQDFLADNSPAAFAKVVDRLLNSTAYGERWGRHWLDVVRYADTAGETGDYPTPLSYKYRNWVINSLNADKPYDQFVREQIAGDILARQVSNVSREKYQEMLTATGFIAISRRFGFDVENYHHLTIQDTIDTVGQALLGLSLGCARCHDHKYDPVNTADYYAWYGIFDSTRYSFPGSEQKKRPYDLFPVLPPAEAERVKRAFDGELARLETEIKKLEAGSEQPDTDASRVPDGRQRLAEVAARLAELKSRRDALQKSGPYGLVYGAIEKDEPKNARIQIRGDRLQLGEEVPRKNLEILGNDPLPAGAGSGRLQLADWLTRESNPLLARVMVNRIWQHHFGRGLVGTENDFGARGQRPTHPELLDWLASRFRESGYSIKAMHRLIMASAAYQRSSEFNAGAFEVDPDTRWLWRFNRRRLSAEEIRDAMLFVSGDLDSTMGSEHPFPPVETWGFTQHTPYYGVYPTTQRSVYLMQQRLKRHPFLGLFDGADTNVSTARRELTTVPTQSLYLMNNEFVHGRSAVLAQRVLTNAGDEAARVDLVYQIALGRPPNSNEVADASDFLSHYAAALAGQNTTEEARQLAAWSGLARTMLIRNEFLFVD